MSVDDASSPVHRIDVLGEQSHMIRDSSDSKKRMPSVRPAHHRQRVDVPEGTYRKGGGWSSEVIGMSVAHDVSRTREGRSRLQPGSAEALIIGFDQPEFRHEQECRIEIVAAIGVLTKHSRRMLARRRRISSRMRRTRWPIPWRDRWHRPSSRCAPGDHRPPSTSLPRTCAPGSLREIPTVRRLPCRRPLLPGRLWTPISGRKREYRAQRAVHRRKTASKSTPGSHRHIAVVQPPDCLYAPVQRR